MANFFDGLAPEDAVEIESLSRLMFELRSNRDRVLDQWQATDPQALLARIEAGEVDEHPAYEHYLSARILDETRQSIRDMLAAHLKAEGGQSQTSLHIELAEWLAAEFGPHLEGTPELKQDALIVNLNNGVRLEIRYAAADAYALAWTYDEQALMIDTAPTHADLASRPNHLHAADGSLRADPLTRCGADPKENLSALLTTLLDDPLLCAR